MPDDAQGVDENRWAFDMERLLTEIAVRKQIEEFKAIRFKVPRPYVLPVVSTSRETHSGCPSNQKFQRYRAAQYKYCCKGIQCRFLSSCHY